MKLVHLVHDFETYCDLDLTKVGAFKYATHPSCKVLCLGYKLGSGKTCLWEPNTTIVPDELVRYYADPKIKKTAFNATFEYLIYTYVLCRDLPEYFKPLPISDFVDIQAICARYKLPQNLLKAGVALNCYTEKMDIGKRLIRKCCQPDGNPSWQDYQDLGKYCKGDVDVSYEILTKLPVDYLTDFEQKMWEITYEMNDIGVPVDEAEVDAIINYLAVYMDTMKSILPEVTNGMVQTVGQVQKIKQFCLNNAVKMDDLTADTVEATLKRDNLPEDVRTVLELRQLLGLNSVKKFLVIKNMLNNGFVQGNLHYHGAGPGRWAGRGFQFHNLPRAAVKDPEAWITKFLNKEFIEKPVETAKALIRPMIKAPEGYSIIVSDYSSIENIILAWLCDDHYTLNLFREGKSQYIDMASELYNLAYEDIKKGTPQYQMGKFVILGCGYQMGAKRFQGLCASFGVIISFAEAEAIIKIFRKKYKLVTKMWFAYANAAQRAVANKGATFKTHKCTFKVVTDHIGTDWLRIIIPSGRSLMYMHPRISEGKFGNEVTYEGVDPTTYSMRRTALTPGLITENIDQGTARDVLCHGKLNIINNMPEVQLILSVHDEAGGLVKNSNIHDGTMELFNYNLCKLQPWMEGMPLKAEGYIAKRYRKE